MNLNFWSGRNVLLTGHTGFKGSWCAAILEHLGAKVSGLSLLPETEPALWTLIAPDLSVDSRISDIRDSRAISHFIRDSGNAFDVVIHMAAQAEVQRGYVDPLGTFSTNVLGTANLLEALRTATDLQICLVVTSDKVYHNPEAGTPFRETDRLGGGDPYSASKAACELVVRSYADSYFEARRIPLVTARAGNVIGGGDWAANRLVPDAYRAAASGRPLALRNPRATRPWQHVLDCLHGYLTYIEYIVSNSKNEPVSLNIGTSNGADLTVSDLSERLCRLLGVPVEIQRSASAGYAERQTLALDVSLAQSSIGWESMLTAKEAIEWTASWYADYTRGVPAISLVRNQIAEYLSQRDRQTRQSALTSNPLQ